MIGLFDRDIIAKLCCCNIWFDVVEILDIKTAYRLPSMTNVFKQKSLFRRFGCSEKEIDLLLERLSSIFESSSVIPDELVNEERAVAIRSRLFQFSEKDSGEVLLLPILGADIASKACCIYSASYPAALK